MKTLVIIVSTFLMLLGRVGVLKGENYSVLNITSLGIGAGGTTKIVLWDNNEIKRGIDDYDRMPYCDSPGGNCYDYFGTESIVNDINYTAYVIEDYRPWECSVFTLELYNKIPLLSNTDIWLRFTFEESTPPPFDNMDVMFFSDALKYGYFVNIKHLIEYPPSVGPGGLTGPYVALTPFTPDTYYYYHLPEPQYGGTYGYAYICICDSGCEDFMQGGGIGIPENCFIDNNFLGFSILARDWKKPQGKYCGDISGPDGIPDGYVDFYDLAEFVKVWLEQ
jgi:hypothetical protein